MPNSMNLPPTPKRAYEGRRSRWSSPAIAQFQIVQRGQPYWEETWAGAEFWRAAGAPASRSLPPQSRAQDARSRQQRRAPTAAAWRAHVGATFRRAAAFPVAVRGRYDASHCDD